MSQLRQAAVSSTGDSQKFSPITWAEYVSVVIELTVTAYQKMYQDSCVIKRSLEENSFTLNLEDYIRPIAFNREQSIFVHSRKKQHTPEMKLGRQPTIAAKEMDLFLHGSWEANYDKIHFVWEAKLVGDKQNYSTLSSEYVNEAIYRFINMGYGANVPDGGVLGYVLSGNVPDLVMDINQSMGRLRKNNPLPASNHLQIAAPVHQFDAIYRSTHTRTDSSLIQLHHLFLTFEFVE